LNLTARPSSGSRQQKPGQQLTIPGGFDVEGELKFKPHEDPEERRHRLRKDAWSFWVKEALAYIVALIIVLITAVYCSWALWHPVTSEERQWVMSTLTSLLVGIVGDVFGKVTK
jgi:hypothetical protein